MTDYSGVENYYTGPDSLSGSVTNFDAADWEGVNLGSEGFYPDYSGYQNYYAGPEGDFTGLGTDLDFGGWEEGVDLEPGGGSPDTGPLDYGRSRGFDTGLDLLPEQQGLNLESLVGPGETTLLPSGTEDLGGSGEGIIGGSAEGLAATRGGTPGSGPPARVSSSIHQALKSLVGPGKTTLLPSGTEDLGGSGLHQALKSLVGPGETTLLPSATEELGGSGEGIIGGSAEGLAATRGGAPGSGPAARVFSPLYQGDENACSATNLAVALNSLGYQENPKDIDRMIGRVEVDSQTGKVKDNLAWTIQDLGVAKELKDRGNKIDMAIYSGFPYAELSQALDEGAGSDKSGEKGKEVGKEFFIKYYGSQGMNEKEARDMANVSVDAVNWKQFVSSMEEAKNSNNVIRISDAKQTFSELERQYNDPANSDMRLIFLVDRKYLENPDLTPEQMSAQKMDYQGHFVTITEISGNEVRYIDTAVPTNQFRGISKERFVQAWSAPGTDNDVTVIRAEPKPVEAVNLIPNIRELKK
jgi:hypothetical protein